MNFTETVCRGDWFQILNLFEDAAFDLSGSPELVHQYPFGFLETSFRVWKTRYAFLGFAFAEFQQIIVFANVR